MIELILRLTDHDERALHALLLRRRPWADHLMRAITHLGGATVAIGIALALLLAVPSMVRAGALAAAALAISHGLVQLIKRSVSRPRPRMPVGLESLVRAPDRFSFPSGHSAAALSVGLPLALALGGLWGWAVLGLALLVGFSRAYLGVHYPGDVLAGWLLAVVGIWAGLLLGL
ncbi:MAG: phosphatase PAP2 family protein [Gemmatimonadetes bacterium]|nr:phosphatase PAP2 family protein [Gemmatimonadota bacterium]NIQ52838.1 phosphatase PAP2 family protein [Gemmatimonadota bacterium]NIU72968.1 phosphatase PAP2 family protein [Gammaproteobacteria bacterium]NIX43323.1 phosphatase PAP2 family protein [Gemmatimonadota bacterium]NIY07493.1 phosphatase PAP2 family protein [Gemmatimonadota bacterium]